MFLVLEFFLQRGTLVEWLERPTGYGAEGRRKVVRWNPGLAIGRLENSFNQQQMGTCTCCESGKQTAANGEDGFNILYAVPEVGWASNLTIPKTKETMRNLYLFLRSGIRVC